MSVPPPTPLPSIILRALQTPWTVFVFGARTNVILRYRISTLRRGVQKEESPNNHTTCFGDLDGRGGSY